MYDLGQHIKLRDDYSFSWASSECKTHYPGEVFYVHDRRLETEGSSYETGWYYHIELVDSNKRKPGKSISFDIHESELIPLDELKRKKRNKKNQ